MRQRQVLVCESDGRLAAVLRERVQTHGWRLSEVRHPRVCLGLLPQGGESVFVLRVGRDVVTASFANGQSYGTATAQSGRK